MTLEHWITSQNLTRQAAADRLGITRQTVYNLVHKKFRPGLDLALRIERETAGEVKATSWKKARK